MLTITTPGTEPYEIALNPAPEFNQRLRRAATAEKQNIPIVGHIDSGIDYQRPDVQRHLLADDNGRWLALDLWDDDYPAGQAPHEIARARYGQIAFANSDAGASAYTHTAIEEAFRAVTSLASSTYG